MPKTGAAGRVATVAATRGMVPTCGGWVCLDELFCQRQRLAVLVYTSTRRLLAAIFTTHPLP